MNLFTFWDGPYPQIIKILEERISAVCSYFGYDHHSLDLRSLSSYIEIPERFSQLIVQHKSDVARVKLINKYGGIWMDSDTLVLGSLLEYFIKIEESDGFFLKNEKGTVTNAVFGSRPQTPFMEKWEARIDAIIQKSTKLPYELMGNSFLAEQYAKGSLSSYQVSDCCGKEAPIRKGNLGEYLLPNRELKKKILTSDPAFLILQAPVYKGYEKLSEEQKQSCLIGELINIGL